MNKKLLLAVLMGFAVISPFVFAEGNPENPEAGRIHKGIWGQAKSEFRSEREQYRINREEIKADRIKNAQDFRKARELKSKGIKAIHAERAEILGAAKKDIEAERAKFKERLSNAKSKEEREAILKEAHARRIELRDEFKSKRQDFREKRTERVKALKSKLAQAASERIKRRMQITQRRFDYVFGRMGRISQRISVAIDKLEERGLDMSKTKDLLAKADEKLSEAKAKYQEATDIFVNADPKSKDEYKELLKQLRGKYKETVTLIKEARRLDKEAVLEIKKAIKKYREDKKPVKQNEQN